MRGWIHAPLVPFGKGRNTAEAWRWGPEGRIA
jgi:hypothetical protein